MKILLYFSTSRPSVQAKKAFIGMFMAGRINSSARHSFGLDFNRFAAMSLVLANSKQVKTDQQQLFCQYIGCYKKRALDTASLNYVSIKQPWYHCDKCEKKYANHPDLKAHIAVAHNSKEVKMFACEWPGCQYSSKQKQNVQFHYLTVHKKEKPYKCHYPGCNKEYSAHHHLLVHQNKVPQISCPFPGCKKTFGSKNSLRKHQKSRGKKRPKQPCPIEGCKAVLLKESMRFHVSKFIQKNRKHS